MPLSDYPGFAHLGADLQITLQRLEAGADTGRRAALERVAEVLDVFVGLDLLQFVFVAEAVPDAGTIDLVAPAQPEPSVAWFSVDEAGYDEYRDAIALIGDLTGVLNPPIVLDVDEGEGNGL